MKEHGACHSFGEDHMPLSQEHEAIIVSADSAEHSLGRKISFCSSLGPLREVLFF
jgi:hypothetical protein